MKYGFHLLLKTLHIRKEQKLVVRLCNGERLRSGNMCFCSSPFLSVGINHFQVYKFSQSEKITPKEQRTIKQNGTSAVLLQPVWRSAVFTSNLILDNSSQHYYASNCNTVVWHAVKTQHTVLHKV